MSFELRSHRDADSLKNGMSINEVFDYLTNMGIRGMWLDENTLVFETCCHNHCGEGSLKMYYYDNTKLFNCYTGCGRFDIFELLSKMSVIENNEELSVVEAIDQYLETKGFVTVGKSDSLNGTPESDKEYIPPTINYYTFNEYLQLPRVIVNDWEREGISAQTQRRYNIRYSYSSSGITLPHVDENNQLMGIRQRLINPQDIMEYGKYRPWMRKGVMYSSPLSFYLFGLQFNSSNIKRVKKAFVMEGEKSCLKGEDMLGYRDNVVVASFGMHFSRHQYEKLKSLGAEEIVFGFDRQFVERGDKEYLALMKIYKSISDRYESLDANIKFSFMIDTELITDYKDAPVDKGFDALMSLYQERKDTEFVKNEIEGKKIIEKSIKRSKYTFH